MRIIGTNMLAKARRLFIAAALLSSLIALPAMTSLAYGSSVYRNSIMLADNLEYVNTIRYSDASGRGESFSLRLTGPGDAYPVALNNDTIYGTFTISRMVSYAHSLGYNVLAAVNSDFFSMQTGVPLGIVIEDGVYKSSPEDRTALCFGRNGGVSFIEEPSVSISLYNNGQAGESEPADETALEGNSGTGGEDSENTSNKGKKVTLTHLNKYRADTGGMYLFTEDFSTVSTRTSSPGWFVKFKILEGELSVSGTIELIVTEMIPTESETNSVSIGQGNMVLTAAQQGGWDEEYLKFDVGDVVTLETVCSDRSLADARFATGGGDILVSDGVKTDPDDWDGALQSRNARTAFGVKSDGTVVSYIIDGRDTAHSVGMTLSELADEFLDQGCVYAINLDGGGSSAISVRMPGNKDCTVVNRPSDGSERGCSTYILYVTDAVSDALPKRLGMKNDGAIVLAGSSLELAYTAVDSGFLPVAVPEDLIAKAGNEGNAVEGARFKAGSSAGTDRVSLASNSTGAAGAGNVFVITQPTSISATRKGEAAPAGRVRLNPGEKLELAVHATYYRRQVTAQLHSFTYTVSGDIGAMTEPGVFRAGAAMFETGKITVSAGETRFSIEVEIGGFEDMRTHWAKEYAGYLAYCGVTEGMSEDTYGPELDIRRCDFVLMLYRAAGEPQIGGSSAQAESSVDCGVFFSDVPEDAYYAKAVAWARSVGITDGTGDGNFSPQSPLTRQQAFTFIYRALSSAETGIADGTAEDLAPFGDADLLAEYAVTPAATLVSLGIVEGSEGMLSPLSRLNRAQMAKILTLALRLYPV